ncbi:AI-2E family transporter [Planctomycetales bacterium ZRK34]|nr:AI-2E family transporter [Planctomycetales bacterium ZRK34]
MTDPSSDKSGCWCDRPLWNFRFVRELFFIALVVFIIWFGYQLQAIFTPVLIGLALAYLFHPLITYCHRRWKMPRPVTISILLAVLGIGGMIVVVWLGPKFIGQLVELAKNMPQYAKTLADRYEINVDQQINEIADQISQDPGAFLAGKVTMLLAGTGQALGVLGSVLGTSMYIVVTMMLIPVYFFFFAWQFGPLVEYFEQFIPASHRDETLRILGRMDEVVATFFRGRVIIAIIMGFMFSIGWWWFNVPYWFLLGMGSGLLSLVPYASVVGWPAAVALKWLSVTTGNDAPGFELWAVVIWPSVVYFVVQALEGWVLTPWIQGKSLDMSVVTILIVVFIGGAVGGLYGLLLCIPAAACIKILMVEAALPRLRQWAAEN